MTALTDTNLSQHAIFAGDPIRAIHWQIALNRNPGEIVTDIDDIDQCIKVILRTPRGVDPHRPEFGSDLWRYIDWPIARAMPHVIRETFEAIKLWEPRAILTQVTPTVADIGHLRLLVAWRPTDDVTRSLQTTEVTL